MARDGRRNPIGAVWGDPTSKRFTFPPRKRSRLTRAHTVRRGLRGRFEFPPTTRSAMVSRHLMRDLLSESLSKQELDVVVLLTNELVTNAIVHSRENFELTVREFSGFVEVEVADSDRRVPVVRAPTPAKGSGRGLAMVESLAQDWGVIRHEMGKAVWFRLAQSPLP
jgi:anti-sigma regulatory factor (Ser/Thr protein kinase)